MKGSAFCVLIGRKITEQLPLLPVAPGRSASRGPGSSTATGCSWRGRSGPTCLSASDGLPRSIPRPGSDCPSWRGWQWPAAGSGPSEEPRSRPSAGMARSGEVADYP